MSDSDQPDAADVQVGESKPKRWVWSETDAFFVNLLIKTCVEIHETGQVLSMPSIHAKVMEIWHRRCIYCLL
jgi:hypothetical protein